MPFRRDIRDVIPCNIVIFLDRIPGPPREGEIWGSEPPVRSDAAYRQITLAPVIITENTLDGGKMQKSHWTQQP